MKIKRSVLEPIILPIIKQPNIISLTRDSIVADTYISMYSPVVPQSDAETT